MQVRVLVVYYRYGNQEKYENFLSPLFYLLAPFPPPQKNSDITYDGKTTIVILNFLLFLNILFPISSSSGGGGVFWKILGLTTIVGGGTVAYAWYDPNFKKTLEGVPYLQDALPYIFKYLPENSKTQSEVVTPIKR